MAHLGKCQLVIAFLCLTSVVAAPTTTTTAGCVEGNYNVVDCYSYFCQGGDWRRFEFMANLHCCKQQLDNQGYCHPRCLEHTEFKEAGTNCTHY